MAVFEIRDWIEFALDCLQTILLVLIAARVYRYGRGSSASRRLIGRDDGRTGAHDGDARLRSSRASARER
jgi:hypothetical protein